MRYSIDHFSSFLGTVTVLGWIEGGHSITAWSRSRYIAGPVEPFVRHLVERPDLVCRYGADSRFWGFKMVFHIGEAHDPKDLYFALGDGTRIEAPYDCRTDEERTFWSMLERFKIVLRSRRNARLLDLGLPPNGSMLLRTFDAPDLAYVGASDTPGPNVDVLVDFDDLTTALPEPFDFVYTASVFDRAWTPWTLAAELGKVLKPGGIAYVQSAGAWPVAADERDFWRISKHAWGALFTPEAGFAVLQVEQAGRVRFVLEQASTLHRGLEHHHHYTLSGCLVQRLEQA